LHHVKKRFHLVVKPPKYVKTKLLIMNAKIAEWMNKIFVKL